MTIDILGTIFFSVAVLHTFLVSPLRKYSHRFKENSFANSFFHLLSEVEVVFGFWAALFLVIYALSFGGAAVVEYQASLHFTEPLFVFAIMVMASTQPILQFCRNMIRVISRVSRVFLRTPETQTDLFWVLVIGPLAGSFITEPAAMTVTALILRSMIEKYSTRLIYFMTAVLFVNISIGGALTHFAAPPILMVAKTFNWDLAFTLTHFGWKSALATIINSVLFTLFFWKEIGPGFFSLREVIHAPHQPKIKIPWAVTALHFVFLIFLVATAHYPATFMGIFLLFLGVTTVTKQYQEELRIKESLLVAFFLAGIIVFGKFQIWWLQPMLSSMTDVQLFFGTTFLTAITDNAALTYLGSQVQGLSELSKYALVAGALAGGGLTVIANAPNPAGYSLLSDKFPDQSIHPLGLLLAGLIPTFIAILCLWYLPFGG